jgi:hypothetical protein
MIHTWWCKLRLKFDQWSWLCHRLSTKFCVVTSSLNKLARRPFVSVVQQWPFWLQCCMRYRIKWRDKWTCRSLVVRGSTLPQVEARVLNKISCVFFSYYDGVFEVKSTDIFHFEWPKCPKPYLLAGGCYVGWSWGAKMAADAFTRACIYGQALCAYTCICSSVHWRDVPRTSSMFRLRSFVTCQSLPLRLPSLLLIKEQT